MLRIFERLDALEKETEERKRIDRLLLEYVEAAAPLKQAAEILAEALRERLRGREPKK